MVSRVLGCLILMCGSLYLILFWNYSLSVEVVVLVEIIAIVAARKLLRLSGEKSLTYHFE